MKGLFNITFAFLLSAMLLGCGDSNDSADTHTDGEGSEQTAGDAETVNQKGSDTMVLLAQKWAEEYQKGHKNVNIQVSGGGSGTGISALINGQTQIANASRPMKDEEKEQMKAKYGVEPYEIAVAKDGISIYLNPANGVEQLTIEQLRGIYEGKIKDWSEVGGKAGKIVLYGRENSSGTYDFFKEHVLEKGDFFPETQALSGTAAVVNAVSKDANGIGYGGAAYSEGVKVAKLVGADGTALEPTLENVTSGAYPLSRDLYMYMAEAPIGAIKEYIDWILSDEGQKFTTEMEYFPVRAMGGTPTAPAAGTDTAAAPEGEAGA